MGTVCFDGGYVMQMTPEKYYICPICNFRITDEKDAKLFKGLYVHKNCAKEFKEEKRPYKELF